MLLDDNYNLKLIDFGISAKIEGEDGNGNFKSRAGTT